MTSLPAITLTLRARADAVWEIAKELERVELWNVARSLKRIVTDLHAIAAELEKKESPDA